MPHALSLRYKKDFDTLFKSGKRLHSRNFSLTFIRADEPRFVFITSKKNIPKANKRNYAKRIAREIVKQYLHATQYLNRPDTQFYHIAINCKTDLKPLMQQYGLTSLGEELTKLIKEITKI